MSNTDLTKNRGRTQAVAKDKHFLPLVKHPQCFSYSQDVFATTKRNQIEITLIRHEPSYKQLGVKTNRTSFVCGNPIT